MAAPGSQGSPVHCDKGLERKRKERSLRNLGQGKLKLRSIDPNFKQGVESSILSAPISINGAHP